MQKSEGRGSPTNDRYERRRVHNRAEKNVAEKVAREANTVTDRWWYEIKSIKKIVCVHDFFSVPSSRSFELVRWPLKLVTDFLSLQILIEFFRW